jgi:hypothetical protein
MMDVYVLLLGENHAGHHGLHSVHNSDSVARSFVPPDCFEREPGLFSNGFSEWVIVRMDVNMNRKTWDAFQPVSGNVSDKAGVGPRIPNAGCGGRK